MVRAHLLNALRWATCMAYRFVRRRTPTESRAVVPVHLTCFSRIGRDALAVVLADLGDQDLVHFSNASIETKSLVHMLPLIDQRKDAAMQRPSSVYLAHYKARKRWIASTSKTELEALFAAQIQLVTGEMRETRCSSEGRWN